MRRFKLPSPTLLGACGLTLGLLAGGCGDKSDSEPMTWSQLEPLYFSSLNLADDAVQKKLPSYEQHMEAISTTLLQQLEDGMLDDDKARTEGGRTLFYQAYLLQAGQQAIEDGYLKAKDFLRPQRYASGGDDTAEEAARLQRSTELLMRAGELRPDDMHLAALGLSGRYNRESLDGQHSPALLLDMLTAARTDQFTLLMTMVLWRDEALNPANAAYMLQLLDAVCQPARFDCNHMGPPNPPPKPLDGERKLTLEVNGQVMTSDLLVRRSETLLASADAMPNPAMKTPLLDEALRRLQFAQGMLGFAMSNAADPALSQYPAKSTLQARADRIQELIGDTTARMSGMGDPPALPDKDYYASRGYRAAYQCVACHTKGTTTMGFPK